VGISNGLINIYSMKKYNNFIKESTNQLSNDVRSLLNDMDDDDSNLVSKVLENIQKSTNLTDSKKIIDVFFTERMKMVDTVINYESYQKIVEVDLTSINVILNTLSKFGDRLKPEELYKESNNKFLEKIFSYTGTKFQGALHENVKLLLIELGKKSGVELEDSDKNNETETQEVVTRKKEKGGKETTEIQKTDTKVEDEKLKKYKKTVEDFRYGVCFKPLDIKLEEIIKERE